MILQLREYEAGTFGLEDAMRQINELKKLKQLRELRIEELIQAGNELGNEVSMYRYYLKVVSREFITQILKVIRKPILLKIATDLA